MEDKISEYREGQIIKFIFSDQTEDRQSRYNKKCNLASYFNKTLSLSGLEFKTNTEKSNVTFLNLKK